MIKINMAVAAVLTVCMALYGCASGGLRDTYETAANLIRVTHADQRIALEGVLGGPIDSDGDGVVTKEEKDATVALVLVLLAADSDSRDDLLTLWGNPRFKVWLAAVAGDIALDEVEARIAAPDEPEG